MSGAVSAALRGLALVVASGAAGVLLGVLGGAAGVVVMVAAPLAVAAGLWAFVRPPVALVLVVLSVPVGLLSLPGAPFGIQVVQAVVFGAASAVVLRRVLDGRLPLEVPRPLVWALLLVVWALVATASATDVELALKQTANLAAGVALALLATTVLRAPGDVRRLLCLLLVSATAVTLPSLQNAGSLRASLGGAVVRDRLQGSFTQPNELGAFALVVVLLAAGLVLGASSGRQRLLGFAAGLPALAALTLSLSRGAWVGAAAGGLALFVLLPAARRAVALSAVPLLLGAGLLGAFAPENPQVQVVGDRLSTARAPAGNPYDNRPRIWAEARREVILDPVTGQGPGNFPVVSVRSASEAQSVQAAHAHDVLLTVAAEMGLVGAALLIALTIAVGFAARDGWSGLDPPDRALLAGLLAACVGIAGQGLVDYTMRNPLILVVDWLVLGLTVALARHGRSSSAVPGLSVRRPPGAPLLRSMSSSG